MFPTIVLFSFLISGSKGIFVSDLYPFGTTWGDTVLDTQNFEDVSSQEIKLNTSVKFFDRNYDSIFVSTLLSISYLQCIPDRNKLSCQLFRVDR